MFPSVADRLAHLPTPLQQYHLDTLAGPQLAIPVAVLLIVLAFGLL